MRCIIKLPDGILTNSSSQYVRDFILERFQLLAVVSLPQCAFAHFGAGVKASVIFVRKRDNNEVANLYLLALRQESKIKQTICLIMKECHN